MMRDITGCVRYLTPCLMRIPKGVIISRRPGALERAHEVFATTGTAAITEALGLDADRNKFPTIIVAVEQLDVLMKDIGLLVLECPADHKSSTDD